MSYTALYRKWRPDQFTDVKGQDHIVTTLKNQIKADRIGHAYLFCGTRGTGKTSVAKIFARAVNCESPVDGSPCGTCAACRSIAAGTSMNVIEIDAASNNGVDNIREIRDEVSYSPTEGKYKVYIIDEVHMLSIGAFNALLKTLEEPPAYVIFILATTESHKIPITILSRCQRYDFKRITIDTIADRLLYLMEEESVEVEERAIRYVAKAADGSMRDALSLLDQCLAFYMGEKLTYDKALEVLGAVDIEVFMDLLDQVLAKDVAQVMQIVDELVMQGRDLNQFVTDFIWHLRNLLLLKTSDNMEDVLDVSSENIARLTEAAAAIESDMLMRYIRIFSELADKMKYATQKRVMLEMALIRLCRPAMEVNMDTVLDRVRAIEQQLEAGVMVPPAAGSSAAAGAGIASAAPAAAAQVKQELPRAVSEDIRQVVQNFRAIISEAPGTLKTFLKHAKLSLGNDNHLQVVFQDEMAAKYVGSEVHREELEQLIADKIGREVQIDVKYLEAGRRFQDNYVDLEAVIHMDITIED